MFHELPQNRLLIGSSLVVGARVVGIAVGISVGAFEGPTGRPVVGAGVRGKIGLPVGE